MVDPGQSKLLFSGRSVQRDPDVSLAKIRRKKDFRDRSAADPWVGELVTDQFLKFLAEAFGDAFVPMGVHAFQDTIRS